MQSLIKRNLPLVFVDRRVPGVESVPFVVSNPYTGIREAVEDWYVWDTVAWDMCRIPH